MSLSLVKYYWYYLDSRFVGYAPVVRLTIIVVMLLLLLYLLSLLRLAFIARRLRREERRRKRIAKRYEKKLDLLLFSDQDLSDESIKEALNIKKNKQLKRWEKEIITEILLSKKAQAQNS